MDFYNHTRRLFAEGAVDIDNLKVLLTDGYTFAAAETVMTNALADEVSGNEWPAGGPVIANAAVATTSTNEATLDGDDISIEADGGDIGPADGLVVYDATNGTPLFHYGFPSAQTAGEGTPFLVNWDGLGIARWRAPA